MPVAHSSLNEVEFANESPEEAKRIEETIKLKENVQERLFDNTWTWNGQTRNEIPGLIKWMLDYGQNEETEEEKAARVAAYESRFDSESTKQDVLGMLRGVLGERISALVPVSQAATVYSTLPKHEIDTLEFADMASLPSGPAKYHLIRNAVYQVTGEKVRKYDLKSLADARNKEIDLLLNEPGNLKADLASDPRFAGLAELIPDNLTTEQVIKWLVESETPKKSDYTRGKLIGDLTKEIVAGYATSRPSEGEEEGIFYQETTSPDAVLKAKGSMIGVVEAKMYMPYELDIIMNKIRNNKKILGRDGFEVGVSNEELSQVSGETVKHRNSEINFSLNIDGEFELVNMLRTHTENKRRLDDMVFMLRVPADASNEQLEELGQMIRNSGRKYVVIQKLPFSSQEINDMASEYIKPLVSDIEKHTESDGSADVKGKKFSRKEIAVLKDLVS